MFRHVSFSQPDSIHDDNNIKNVMFHEKDQPSLCETEDYVYTDTQRSQQRTMTSY